MAVTTLPLKNIADRHIGMTRAIAECWLEAARVCLDRHHSPPQPFVIRDDGAMLPVVVEWDQTDERCRAAWANEPDATRDGAYVCAVAATELARNLVAVRRAEALSHADYYVGPPGSGVDDIEDCLRLEVSGTDQGKSEVTSRLKEKVAQVAGGTGSLPALAAVVGFRVRQILIQTVKESQT